MPGEGDQGRERRRPGARTERELTLTPADTIWTHANLATFSGEEPYGAIQEGALAIRSGRIAWVGRCADLPPELVGSDTVSEDLGGRWVTPGFVDCHTHLVFAGDRSDEFERRLRGESYEAIAWAGGGIRATVAATRAASEEALLALARARLHALQAGGVTTVEIKSGYGLDLETELRMLSVARALGEREPVRVVTTLLGAHALPQDFEGRRGDYVRLVCDEMIPAAAEAGLVDQVDAFCETVAFTAAECAQVFEAAHSHDLPVRLHADQLSDSGGAALAAEHRALSADHLEFASEEGVQAMAAAGTVAVLLPGACYTLRQERRPPVRALRELGVPIALATDANPGSSPILSLPTVLNLGCTLFGLTPPEALAGVTRNAARALGFQDEIGTLEEGKRADLAVWDVDHPRSLCTWVGTRPLVRLVKDGRTTTTL